MRRFLLLLLFVLMLGVAACRTESLPSADQLTGQRGCTEIGCSSGLTVRLVGNVPDAFTIAAQRPGQPPIVAICPEGRITVPDREAGASAICQPDGVFFDNFTPEEVEIVVRVGQSNNVSRLVKPTYEKVQPNGPGCPPVCEQAVVEIELP